MSVVFLGQSELKTTLKMPFFLSTVSAGFPSPAQDYVEKTLDLNELLIQRPAATYFVRAEGDSMQEAGIHSGDILIVDRSIDACHGDIVIAALQGELTVKQLELKPVCRLLPCNPRYRPIVIPEGSDLELFGVVTNVIHSFR
ncbi:translesion error-prone DNA polymerase V autoproteolytic subunit [Neptuniibacter sp.]|uniref:translesion error-prone DNA polymerase V autoproteolytic subunit n=1 Tax=Neptuniibacter sp. TaxID=1962643 RepID=UPI0026243CCC|nr:translesion error-prone DNA polymerase V autoproteolytic subunit [Neptuniibacter sp.]MCP4597172.1 translesion error-prone DNA polymerase V autoproteolytic subunit [Neptuniibacter sp.]